MLCGLAEGTEQMVSAIRMCGNHLVLMGYSCSDEVHTNIPLAHAKITSHLIYAILNFVCPFSDLPLGSVGVVISVESGI